MAKRAAVLRAGLLSMLVAVSSARADQLDELRNLRDTTIALVNALVEQGVLSRAQADALIQKAQRAGAAGGRADGATVAAAGPTPPPGTVRVPYIPETVKQEIREEVKQDVLAQAHTERWGDPGVLPEWTRRLTWSGDARFRFEADRFPNDGTPNVPAAVAQQFGYNINNTTDPVNRLRVRARFGITADVADKVTAGIRLASGNVGSGSDPYTESQTLGNYNTRTTLGFDRLYINYQPWSWLGITGGRLGNPFFAPTTLVWADDLSLDGVALHYAQPHILDLFGFMPDLAGFATVGAFPIQQVQPTPLTSARSKWLFGYQGGIAWELPAQTKWTFAGAYYDFKRIEGVPNASIVDTSNTLTGVLSRQFGNTYFDINGLVNQLTGSQNYVWGLASKFREVNAATTLDVGFFAPIHVIADLDYVRNIGFDAAEILQRTGYQVTAHNSGYQGRLTVGTASRLSDRNGWQAFVGYRHVDGDAVVDAFTDADFHLGGTDAKGYFIGGAYAFANNSILNVRWMSGRQIYGLPLAIDVLQADVNVRF